MLLSAQRLRRVAGLIVKRRKCLLCGWAGYRFEPFGNSATWRTDAQCPICGSVERQRLAFFFLRDEIQPGQRVLHVAPEPLMIPWLVSRSCEYLNIDLYRPAMQRMDLMALELPDCSRSLIWCSHVLEHVADDRIALREMFRVLAPGGLLVLQVPIGGDRTDDDPSVITDSARLTRFLQEDHVRLYGLDLKDRIESCGFACTVLSASQIGSDLRVLYGIDATYYREVFLCRRPLGP